jgi:PPOX class probable F420-dependent enzyme
MVVGMPRLITRRVKTGGAMNLDVGECWRRCESARRGVLATVHRARGVDAVPVVFATVEGEIVIPIDTVKAKSTTALQRVRNLRADPRAVLLVDEYDDDWSRLWWVRVHGAAIDTEPTEAHLRALAARYAQYRGAGAIERVIALSPTKVIGWRAQ